MCNENESIKLYKLPSTVTQTKDTAVDNTTVSQNTENNSVKLWQQSLPEVETINNTDIDVSELVKQYKDSPINVLDVLGINFSEKEVQELKTMLTDKKELKSFLNLIKENEALKSSDILAAMRNVKEYTPKGFFKRIGNVFKTAFKEGIGEAFELAKSETVYFAGKLGKNMDDVRTERQDFSSNAVVDVAETMTKLPETKVNIMHFAAKSQKDGSKLYTEQDVLKAKNIIVNNIDAADDFTANAVELESIQTKSGNIKYKGSTIINVGEKMTNNPKVKPTMYAVAKKSDMTDDCLINTTSNLAQNYAMAESIEYLATAKDKNGNDRFTAQSVSDESAYLRDKNKDFCVTYHDNLLDFTPHPELSGNDIISITHNVTEHPEIKPQVIDAIKNNLPNSQIREIARSMADNIKKSNNQPVVNQQARENEAGAQQTYRQESIQNTQPENKSASNQNVTTPIENTFNRAQVVSKTYTSNLNPNIINISTAAYADTETIQEATVINGQVYERSTVLNALTKKYGASAEKVLNAIEKDPGFIELMKQYNGNQVIINALVEDPYLITKIKKAGGSLSVNEIADIVKLCTDATSTDVMLQALQNYSPAEAMKITRQSKIFNLKDDTLNILSKASSTNTSKKSELEDLYMTGGKKEMIC